MIKDLSKAKVLEKFKPHVLRVQFNDGIIKIIKAPHEGSFEEQIRELIHEIVISDLFTYGKVCSAVEVLMHDLRPWILKEDFPEPWSILEAQPETKIENAESFPHAFVIDWITGQKDRWLDSKDNARFQKLEAGSLLFAPTDNGNALSMHNGETKPEENIDSSYTSRLLFSTRIESREEMEKAINDVKSWPIHQIAHRSIERLLESCSSYSVETIDFILKHYTKTMNYINNRLDQANNKLIAWYDETHTVSNNTEAEEQVAAV